MTTFADVIERTRRRLLTNMRPGINVLSAGITDTDTALTFTQEYKGGEGTRISIDLEDMHGLAGSTSSGTSVLRGMDGSIPVAHSAGAIVRLNPPWTNFEIANAINEELDSLSGAGLFRVRSKELTFNPSTRGYDLAATDFLSVWRVSWKIPGPENEWPALIPQEYRVDLSSETDDFASGQSIVVRSGGYPGQQVRVSYRAAFTRLAALTDDVTAVSGLHPQAHNLLDLGAAIRLMSGEDVKRALSIAQANPRRADEVPPSTGARAIEPLGKQYDRDLNREIARLTRQYPQAL